MGRFTRLVRAYALCRERVGDGVTRPFWVVSSIPGRLVCYRITGELGPIVAPHYRRMS